MTDKENQKTSDNIKSPMGGPGKGPTKKKIVIKKKGVQQKKDISEHFDKPRYEQKPAGRGNSASAEKQPASGSASRGPAPEGNRPQSSRNSEGKAPDNRNHQGGSSTDRRTGDDRPGRMGSRPQGGGGQRSGGPGGQRSGGQRPGGSGGQRPGGQRAGGQRSGGQGGQRPGGQGGQRSGGPGMGGPQDRVSFAGAGTPFDALIESSRKAVSANQQKGGRPPARKGPPDNRKAKVEEKNENFNRFNRVVRKKKSPTQSGTTVPDQIEIMENIQVGELAKKLNLKPGDVIGRLMKMGEMVTINQTIDSDIASLVAGEFGCEVKVISLYEETVIDEQTDEAENRTNRPPVVTIMGHVDHGKTKLLDTIRKTNVIDTEAGAITQHIGAYQVVMPDGGKITFLDTPGHEAFTAMRARGAAVTDIVILVVAADDGVKTQTIEALTHAKEAHVPIIVAVNKIDKPAANVDRVKQELSNYGLQPEEWGGETVFCEISALNNIGLEHLLEMVLIQAELMDLKANSDLMAVGRVVEAKIDAGKGPVATVLVQKGTLHEGDPYVVGIFAGRVRAMFDDLGRRIKVAGPAFPVEITGIDGVPEAGDPFQVVSSEKYGREIAGKRQHYKQITAAAQRVQPSLGDLHSWIQDHKELKVIIKADVQGSVEAIREGLSKLSHDDVKVIVIHGATGAISESDVTLATASNALIVGFQVRATPRALTLAEENHVEIKYYSVIYHVIEEITQAMEGLLDPDEVEEVIGRAEVRQVFRISRIGNVAGCMVVSGKIKRAGKVRLLRDNVVIYTGDLKALKRHKDDVGEVAEGFECGMSIEKYNDIQEGDIIEAFEIHQVKRKLEM